MFVLWQYRGGVKMVLTQEIMNIWDIEKIVDKSKVEGVPILRITSPIHCPFRQNKYCQIQIMESCSQQSCELDTVRPVTCPFESTFLFVTCEK